MMPNNSAPQGSINPAFQEFALRLAIIRFLPDFQGWMLRIVDLQQAPQ